MNKDDEILNALDAYWSARSQEDERAAYVRLQELGCSPGYGEIERRASRPLPELPPFRKPAPPSDQEAMLAVRTLLEWIGDDPTRPGLRDTPERVLKAWREDWGRGYQEPSDGLVKLFPEDGIGNESLICMNDITVESVCEHHMAPFTGTASIGYISDPARGIVGLSKLARIVDHFSRRLQVQERLTNQIANFVETEISGIGVGVVLRCSHSCMSSRGVQQPNAITITSALRGAFYDDGKTRSEFLRLAKA